jgi:hypothetical protein
MRIKAVIVLATLLLTLTAPFSIHLSGTGDTAIIITPDVCNASNTSLSVNADSPVIFQCIVTISPQPFTQIINICDLFSFTSISISKPEYPPEA